MTYRELVARLRAAGIPSPETEARILLTEYCRATAADLAGGGNFRSAALEAALTRRTAHEPLAYILGKWNFYNEEYFVSPDCLIPRADTEILVEKMVQSLPRGARFLDLCTGSGCVAISLAKHRPDTVGLAADVSDGALLLAQKNAAHNRVENLSFFKTDVCAAQPPRGLFDAISANPPYIRTAVCDTLSPEVLREPRTALDGGGDGLRFYRAILENFREFLAPAGAFYFEFGYDQKDDARRLAETYGYRAAFYNDYGGNFRVAVFTK